MTRLRQLLDRICGFSVMVTIAALALAGLVAAALVIGVGLYNVSARKGHFAPVEWALHTTFRNSVKLRASEPAPDALDTPEMIALGAGHYEQACRMCHGRPGATQSATIRAMEPAPPHLQSLAGDWSAGELHWIIHQGAKMTGMPAWPAARKDDVWPVVAFLRAAVQIDGASYDRLTGGEAQGRCSMCHGADGASRNPLVPRLDILSPDYIAASLRAYRGGQRDSGIMAQAASGLSDAEIKRLSTSFDAPPGAMPATATGPSVAVAARGRGSVPSCRACHGPWPAPLNRGFPSLSGQHEPYLRRQLKLWRDGPRGGGELAQLMHIAARDLSDAEIDALAAYYATMPQARLNPNEGSGR
ncbi:c-type cytochrome [Paracoccus aestuariivivens]|uniref:C-type cytochrome n=1 Tax=Paracoccus aestuariivivens TaxID=1820333 RepID=A0A6L6JHC1_9RHOB|nr:c-type cytochrome [Paracoccus aestuariivivens]MTH79927.1 c-type cytochrome [Paracoccus aestuariivivens]